METVTKEERRKMKDVYVKPKNEIIKQRDTWFEVQPGCQGEFLHLAVLLRKNAGHWKAGGGPLGFQAQVEHSNG